MKKLIYTNLILILFLNTGYSQYTVNFSGSFNGSSSYIAVPNASNFNPAGAITLEAWVNPAQLGPATMAVIGKNYQTSYFLGIQVSGRVVFYPKGGISFRSRVTGLIPVNKWTHIAATYDGSTTTIYINGVLDTSTTAITGGIGINTDSLFIGADRVGTQQADLFFKGKLDNVRIWGNARYGQVIFDNRFVPLEVYSPTGYFEGLRASFQLDNSTTSYSGSSLLFGYPRNFTFTNYSNKAVNNMDYNNNLVLNGTTDYFTVSNTSGSGFNPTTAITLEAWIRRDTSGSQPVTQNIVNKSGGSSRYDYALFLYPTGQLFFSINSGATFIESNTYLTNAQWTHVAATYNSSNGNAIIYINGDSVAGGIFSGNPVIQNNPDDLYIGGIGASSYAANKFKGQIDGVRIWSLVRKPSEIKENMYTSITSAISLTHFDFDKFTNAIYAQGATIFTSNTFGGLAHIGSSHLNYNTELTSPSLSDVTGGYYSTNYTASFKRFFVPDNNPTGITDSIYISATSSITNLKAFVLMSHTYISDMSLNLISPSGSSIILFNHSGADGNDLMTIFSDAADSMAGGTSLNGPGINPPFSPGVKPAQALSLFNGQNPQGWWKLKFVDFANADHGYVQGWGLNIPPARTLLLTCLLQGFYNSTTNKMIKDTVRVFLRSANSPYSIIDSAKTLLDSLGRGYLGFNRAVNGVPYYIVVKHRNTIETWSYAAIPFNVEILRYDFTPNQFLAFGNNMILVDVSLSGRNDKRKKDIVRPAGSTDHYAFYSGDENQDGTIDISDIIDIYNDANNFATGYVRTDINGDGTVDVSDIIITYNNLINFVSVIRP